MAVKEKSTSPSTRNSPFTAVKVIFAAVSWGLAATLALSAAAISAADCPPTVPPGSKPVVRPPVAEEVNVNPTPRVSL